MTRARLRLLIADDHAVVRAGLRALLEGEEGFEVAGEASSGEDAVRLAGQLVPDVVLMDLRFAGVNQGIDGVEAIRRLAIAAPGVPVVMLTSYAGRADAVRALGAGARGYVLKAGPPEELFRAVRSAAAGGLGLAPEIVDGLVGQVVSPDPDLTTREIEVIRLLASGRSNRAIAEALFLSEATVKTHLVRIYRKLGADNRAAAVSEAVRRGLLELT
ncbi:two-component system response regulator [Amycolatopsis mediterranei S699]|uniref:Two-component system response regulator n=4 Tax=Amycolatopsis mediterranei TaxID=33910 RepID=A0A0H3D9H3_AMYMU|nr:response regulator transcription factor [Amycolatopsis mediterranei]ADJ47266.1 two-component system response regulator [Amycolatopsis mediterranei U32]AEK44091.1 two-component system response regulator [Amycolatopsis mediterranei S699]AFO78977.1 two-component system response regulator [Amycolatopsis mediterranei S699]AGT86105.1 two-component system response regulator [Amycolatopsis mediterranei RB]KDO04772.1 LuxR family transcriptional regulator [Amycolatopsis mediterranei]